MCCCYGIYLWNWREKKIKFNSSFFLSYVFILIVQFRNIANLKYLSSAAMIALLNLTDRLDFDNLPIIFNECR